MATMKLKKIRFISSGFAGVLTSPGISGEVASAARKEASRMESRTGEAYEVEQGSGWDGRTVYWAKPEGAERRVEGLDHETWMSEVWPRVGGPSWRPHS